MSRRGSARFMSRRRKPSVLEVDVTSLLDILTILLAFLINNFDATGVRIHVPAGISLPDSHSQSVNTNGVSIQVSADKIWVENKEVLNSETMPDKMYDMDGRRIVSLFNELVSIKESIKQTEKISPDAVKFSGIANLVLDKSLKYSYIRKIMFTCAEAGFKEYKFVVRNLEQ
ncbi:MAG: biopolymer transporter ExbD [Bacteriovoracaceae bacterium]|nr:biopolymer transporter ExbD [Bacteriovoracaceae bacterium]